MWKRLHIPDKNITLDTLVAMVPDSRAAKELKMLQDKIETQNETAVSKSASAQGLGGK